VAAQVNEKTLFGRTGGAATLAVGMANILSQVTKGRWLDLWYHFAIMFEALFILTTLDAGTRVGRYLIQDVLGNFHKPLGDTKSVPANVLASLLVVTGWGYFLIQGVRDPLGGINSLWPLFGIANQLLASIALCLATTVILKMHLPHPDTAMESGKPRPGFALVTLVPLVWLLAVTMTAGVQKIFHSDPNIGFLSQATSLGQKAPALEQATENAKATGNTDNINAAQTALRRTHMLQFNNILDAIVAGRFLALAVAIASLRGRAWVLPPAPPRTAALH